MEEQLGWACKLGWVSGYLQGGSDSVSQPDGVSDMAPVCWLCGGESLEKGQWPLLTLMLDTSVPLFMPLVPLSNCHPGAGAQREKI